MSAQVAADLRAAADLIERDGWTQERYHEVKDGRICHCAMGAIAYVVTGREFADPDEETVGIRFEYANQELKRVIGAMFTWEWNDAPGRTGDEVIAALRAAADRAEAEQ